MKFSQKGERQELGLIWRGFWRSARLSRQNWFVPSSLSSGRESRAETRDEREKEKETCILSTLCDTASLGFVSSPPLGKNPIYPFFSLLLFLILSSFLRFFSSRACYLLFADCRFLQRDRKSVV